MQITDPVADMLTRIRNANTAKHENDNHCKQRKNLLHNRIPLYNNVSRAEALRCVSVT